MNRTNLRTLEPESTLQRIDAAKSNKPFMTALLDRGHPGHKDALAHWTLLHDVAFEESAGRAAEPRRPSTRQASTRDAERGSARRAANIERRSESRRVEALTGRATGAGSAEARGSRQAVYPDPERPLDVDRSVISPFMRRQDESEGDWLKRVTMAANGPRVSIERLAIIREAILREIGFYDLGSGVQTDDGAMRPSDWRVLAALQNVPVDGWESALSVEDEARAEFEQRGILGSLEVLGPDGKIYHRLSILGENPVGDALTTVDQRIRMLRLADPDLDVLLVLPAIALSRPGREGGTPARSPLATTVAPRIHQFIRSPRGAATVGLGTGIGLGLVGDAAMDRRMRSEMDAAPDLPPAPGFEPPERSEPDLESFPADLPPIPPLPGFMPEDYANLVEVFPDQRGDLPLVDILDNRLGNEETQLFNTNTMRAVRDLITSSGLKIKHIGGGLPYDGGTRSPEHYLPPAKRGRAGASYLDIAFQSTSTERKLLINTVDTRADNSTPTGREERAAVRILANSDTGDILILLPKPPRGRTYDLERFLEWLRPHLEEIDRDLPEGSEGHQRDFSFH